MRVTSADFVNHLLNVLSRAGDGYNGMELVTQRAHALQCGLLAEKAGAPAPLVAAAFLHDVGHLLGRGDAGMAKRGFDARHEEIGADFLARFFPQSVTEPVRLHVIAKRYLCAVEPGYFESLSEASVVSLAVQGGPMSEEETSAFLRHPFAAEAIALRQWDDLAKDPDKQTPDVAYFAPVLKDNVVHH